MQIEEKQQPKTNNINENKQEVVDNTKLNNDNDNDEEYQNFKKIIQQEIEADEELIKKNKK